MIALFLVAAALLVALGGLYATLSRTQFADGPSVALAA